MIVKVMRVIPIEPIHEYLTYMFRLRVYNLHKVRGQLGFRWFLKCIKQKAKK